MCPCIGCLYTRRRLEAPGPAAARTL
jgi:hypothetical protein